MPQWAGSCWYYLRFLDPDERRQALGDGRVRRVDARRPLRRRRRARGAPPPLRPLLAQGALRSRSRPAPRAVHEARAPGDDPGRGQRADVEVAGQRRESRRHRAGVRRRRAPALRDVHGAARGREAVADLADPGRGALPRPAPRGLSPAPRGRDGRRHAPAAPPDHQEGQHATSTRWPSIRPSRPSWSS